MDWKSILKAELPPKQEAGSPVNNELRMQMDAWAAEYNRKIINYLNEIGDTMNSAWCKVNPQTKQVTWNRQTFSFDEFANELKSLLRAAAYDEFNQVNYAFLTSRYLEDAERYVRDMMRNSTASNVFDYWIRK